MESRNLGITILFITVSLLVFGCCPPPNPDPAYVCFGDSIMSVPAWQRAGIQCIWPCNHRVFFELFEPEGPQVGDRLVQKDLSHTLRFRVDGNTNTIDEG